MGPKTVKVAAVVSLSVVCSHLGRRPGIQDGTTSTQPEDIITVSAELTI